MRVCESERKAVCNPLARKLSVSFGRTDKRLERPIPATYYCQLNMRKGCDYFDILG